MTVLAIEKEVDETTKEQFTPFLKEEAERIWELYKAGIVREIYFGKSAHNAVLILECRNETEAEEILSELPLVKEKLITFKILTLIPYDGFERLLKN